MAQEHITVDDNVIDSAIDCVDVQAVIDPVWLSVNIYDSEQEYRHDLEKFSPPQQYVFAVWWYQAEVNNGGHYQFFSNSAGITWEDALNGLAEIGLTQVQQILKEAIERMGGHPSKNRAERLAQLDGLNEERFEDLDSRFYEYEMGPGIGPGLLEYVGRNRASFYFDGMVNRDW